MSDAWGPPRRNRLADCDQPHRFSWRRGHHRCQLDVLGCDGALGVRPQGGRIHPARLSTIAVSSHELEFVLGLTPRLGNTVSAFGVWAVITVAQGRATSLATDVGSACRMVAGVLPVLGMRGDHASRDAALRPRSSD